MESNTREGIVATLNVVDADLNRLCDVFLRADHPGEIAAFHHPEKLLASDEEPGAA
jgi:hypothetical protein